jgi:hypothetical protein
MAIGDIVKQRAVVELTLDAKDYKQGARDVKAASDDTKRAIETIGVQSEQSRGLLERLADAGRKGFESLAAGAQKAKAGTSSFLGGIDSIGKAMAPWNQALELGGKALAAVDAGLEAFSKTSPEAASEVKRLRDDFTGAKDAALAFTGAVVVAATKPLMSLKELETQIRGVTGAFQDAFNASKNGEGMAYLLRGGFIDDAKKSLAGQADPWASTPDIGAGLDAARKQYEEKLKTDAAKRSAAQKAYANRERDVSEFVSISGMDQPTDTAGPLLGWSPAGQGISPEMLEMNDQLNDQMRRMSETVASVEGPTLLERLGLQDTEPFTLAIAAVESFGDAWQSSLQAIGEGNMSAAAIFKKGLAAVVKGIGDQLAALAAAELVKGAAAAVLLNPRAFQHFAAAGIYSGGAIAAYAASSKLGSGGGGGGGGGASAGGGTSGVQSSNARGGGTASTGNGGGGGSTTNHHTTIVFGDPFAMDSPRMRQVSADRLVRQATGTGSATHS